MFQRRAIRSSSRSRSLVLGGVVAALAVVGGGTVAVVSSPSSVEAGDILLAQNAADQGATQEMPLGTAVKLDLEPVVARAAGGTIPAGTTVQITGLPDGLSQDGWVISGTPTRAGVYDVLVTVSNSGVSKSQKVAITVTDDVNGATTPTTTAAEPATTDESDSTAPSATSDESDATDPSTQPEPTLSARAGSRALTGEAGADQTPTEADGTGTGEGDELGADDDEVGTSPDMCAALEGGQLDSASLAQLLPAVTGDEDSASTGLALMLVNSIAGLLPSVLGEDGLLGDLGSAGTMLCTLAPSLLGSQGGTPSTGDGTTGEAGTDLLGETEGAGATELGGAALPIAPSALLGLLTTGAGSLGE